VPRVLATGKKPFGGCERQQVEVRAIHSIHSLALAATKFMFLERRSAGRENNS
jgi:hypothetical protein